MSKKEIFFSKTHKKEFVELLEQANLDKCALSSMSELERRQVAFLYLIALYQEEYKRYEGCKFYVEDFGELSLDGPTYLLEENYVSLSQYDHEVMLSIAMQILKQTCLKNKRETLQPHLQEPFKMAVSISEDTLINYIV